MKANAKHGYAVTIEPPKGVSRCQIVGHLAVASIDHGMGMLWALKQRGIIAQVWLPTGVEPIILGDADKPPSKLLGIIKRYTDCPGPPIGDIVTEALNEWYDDIGRWYGADPDLAEKFACAARDYIEICQQEAFDSYQAKENPHSKVTPARSGGLTGIVTYISVW